MEIIKVNNEDSILFKLSGSLDSTTAPMLEAELIPEFENSKIISLDFQDIKYISSAGMRVLLKGDKTAKAKDGKLSVLNVSPFVMEIFDITGFSNILNFG